MPRLTKEKKAEQMATAAARIAGALLLAEGEYGPSFFTDEAFEGALEAGKQRYFESRKEAMKEAMAKRAA